MTSLELKNRAEETIKSVLHQLQYPVPDEIPIAVNKDPRLGDWSSNIAMMLAKPLKKNPREIAQNILSGWPGNITEIEKVEIAGNGFINFFLSADFFRQLIRTIIGSGGNYGCHTIGNGLRVNVEFVSANPTGPLSLGHGRQAVFGDVICRILENAGYSLTREYYFNNAGFQMKRLGESVRLRYLELLGEPITFPEGLYEGAYITDVAASIRNQYADTWKNNPSADFQKFAENVLFEQIREILKTIRLKFDVYYNEDSLYQEGRIQQVIDAFREKGLVYEKEGAVWLKTSAFEYPEGQKPEGDKVIVKATGEPTYRLPDIAYHITKFERKFDRIIDIFGADHIAQYPDVIAALKVLGFDTQRMRVLIHQFVTLTREGEILKMSKRKANFVTIAELVEALGVDVFRYFLVMRSHHSHLNFDMQLAVSQTMENPVYYIQNAHARICSIEKKAAEKGIHVEKAIQEADLNALEAEEELNILRKLAEYPDLTLRLAENLEAHPLTTYLEELAGRYHHYQTAGKKVDTLRVLTADARRTAARLALCRATKMVLAHGLQLLGVSAPEYMEKTDELLS